MDQPAQPTPPETAEEKKSRQRADDNRTISLAWSMPVTILLWTLVGYYVGNKFQQHLLGTILGWLLGMIVVVYELVRPGQK